MKSAYKVALGCLFGWVILTALFTISAGGFARGEGWTARGFGAAGIAMVVTLIIVRISIEAKNRKIWDIIGEHIEGRATPDAVLLTVMVEAVRFAVSWTYLFALSAIGIVFGLEEVGRATGGEVLPPMDAVSGFLHWGLSLASVVLFLDALLHVSILIRGMESREVLHALVSGLAGVTILVLVPLKEIPLLLFKESAHVTSVAVLEMGRALWLPVLIIVGLVGTIVGLLLTRRWAP